MPKQGFHEVPVRHPRFGAGMTDPSSAWRGLYGDEPMLLFVRWITNESGGVGGGWYRILDLEIPSRPTAGRRTP